MKRRVVVGITGASGGLYAARLLRALEGHGDVDNIDVVITAHGRTALSEEMDLPSDGDLDLPALLGTKPCKIRIASDDAIEDPMASGSNPTLGMVIVPCSMGTLAKVAHGLSDSLLTRAADVCLKERRPLLLAVRETPLSRIHLQNLLLAADAGARIIPAMPAFYARPKTLEEMADHYVGRLLSHLGLASKLERPWTPRSP